MDAPEPPEDLAAALNELPLFPLRHAVLFPGVLLPLHVFEPRYVTMVRDSLDTHRCLSIVQITDPHADLSGNPPIAETAGVGTIVDYSELPGSRYNLLLVGRARARIQERSFVPPYRRAIANLLRSHNKDVPPLEVAALHAAAAAFAAIVSERDSSFEMRLPKDATPGVIADACAHALVIDPREKQAMLETLDVRKRVRDVTAVLTVQRTTLQPENSGMLN